MFFGESEWSPPSHRLNAVVGRKVISRHVPEDEYLEIFQRQREIPVVVMTLPERRRIWWCFRDHIYHHSDEEQDPEVIKGLILQKLDRDTKRREKAREVARQADEMRP